MGKEVALTEKMQIVEICESMNWTYHEYMEQPAWFINTLQSRSANENKANSLKNRKHGRH